MEVDSFIQGAVFLLLLGLIALLTNADSVIASVSRSSLLKSKEKGKKAAAKILRIYHPKQKLHLAVAIAKSLVTLLATLMLILLVQNLCSTGGLCEPVGLAVAMAVALFAFFFAEEVLPRRIARGGENSLLRVASLVYVLYILLLPLINLLYSFSPKEQELKEIKEEELKSIVEAESEEGVIEKVEKEMIRNIFEFSETSVKEVMVPRIDMVCAEISIGLQELIALISEAGHSRIPVYEETVDNIQGIIYAKDLLPILGRSEKWEIRKIMREPYFVPENKKIDEMLREFKAKKIHMAVVVDEYGGTAGLVTLEDLIEEIVGEIQDEYDTEEQLYRWVDKETLLADAKIDIHDLNELLGADLPRNGFETLGGFIYNHLGSIPQQGETLEFKNLEMSIQQVNGQRITKVKIVKKRPSTQEEDEQ
ncbi:MAG: hypothetical protein B1H40_00290 [Candidatus Latescibacteria bacterium 4484_181]|nr:MAG: hypothetical protein B1H40_00290 [Candidatus Latescibacteria bacterium 4484_181]RKY68815.1 MAG: hemolysin [Candidatus Latescibacterota bacterium]RKY72363.1 MAG: hemolysin [Candidatus Latescibacterota bacterium]